MKECPQCHAVTFDDMRVCYGCLHVFAEHERNDPTLFDAVLLPLPSQMSVLPADTVVSQCSSRDVARVAQDGSSQSAPSSGCVAEPALDHCADLCSIADIDLSEADLPREEFCLCVDEGTGRVERHPFGAGRSLVVGRSHGCDVELHDPMASRRHLQVEAQGGQVVLSDLGSSNPTYVDGLPLEGRAVAALGACITIARAKLWAERAQSGMGVATQHTAM